MIRTALPIHLQPPGQSTEISIMENIVLATKREGLRCHIGLVIAQKIQGRYASLGWDASARSAHEGISPTGAVYRAPGEFQAALGFNVLLSPNFRALKNNAPSTAPAGGPESSSFDDRG